MLIIDVLLLHEKVINFQQHDGKNFADELLDALQVKRLKTDDNAFVMVVAFDNPDWIDRKQIDSIASVPISDTVFTQRVLDMSLAERIQSRICGRKSLIIMILIHLA